MKRLMILLTILIIFSVYISNGFYSNITGFGVTDFREKPVVVWYVIAKWLEPDFLDKVDKYKPDIVLLTLLAEDDIVPYNLWRGEEKVRNLVEQLHDRGVKVFFSYSLFSRAPYDEVVVRNIDIEDNIHVSDFSKYLKDNEEGQYHRYFDYYYEHGIDPEEIPKVLRKPVDGYYIPIGHYTVVDPLYEPYREFLIDVINETLQITKPDGLAFDHIRFFTFDEGYNQDIRDFILKESGLDVYNYTPKPMFHMSTLGQTEEDKKYYDSRAKLIEYAVSDVVGKFPEFEKFGTTMGMIEPARSNGQYVELQANIFDSLLLMAYDDDANRVIENVKETIEKSKTSVILGIFPFDNDETAINNIKAGIEGGADGVYLLGYNFTDSVHEYLLEIRGIG